MYKKNIDDLKKLKKKLIFNIKIVFIVYDINCIQNCIFCYHNREKYFNYFKKR